MDNPTFDLLKRLGFRRRENRFILDEFSPEYYLMVDGDNDTETPESSRTVDVYVMRIGTYPEAGNGLRILINADGRQIIRLFAALGVRNFPEKTRKAFYESFGSPLRSAE